MVRPSCYMNARDSTEGIGSGAGAGRRYALLMADLRLAPVRYPEEGPKEVPQNDLHFSWLILLRENLRLVFVQRDDVYVSADSYWYPVEGHPEESTAPDVYVVVGRPPGDRSSYLQWLEQGVAPLVTIEVLSPSNYTPEGRRRLADKLERAERFGVQEYLEIDPLYGTITVWERRVGVLEHLGTLPRWESARLGGVTFVSDDGVLRVLGPNGEPFSTLAASNARAETEAARAETEAARADAQAARVAALEEELATLRRSAE